MKTFYKWMLLLAVCLAAGCGTLLGTNYGGDNPWRHTDGTPWYGPSSEVATNFSLSTTLALEARPDVQKAMHRWLQLHPVCAYCGRTNKVNGCVLNAHHKLPVHLCFGSRANMLTNTINFISLCRDPDGIGDHGRYGHGTNGHFVSWSFYNPSVELECRGHQIDRGVR